MKKLMIILLITIVFSSFSYAIFERKIYTSNYIVSGPYALLGGDVWFSSLNVSTINYKNASYINVTGNVDLGINNLTTTGSITGLKVGASGKILYSGDGSDGKIHTPTPIDVSSQTQVNIADDDGISRAIIQGTIPILNFVDTNGATNQKLAAFVTDSGAFKLVTANDTGSTVYTPLSVNLSNGRISPDKLFISDGSNHQYLIGNSNNRMWIQNQVSGYFTRLDLFNKDGDGTDYAYFTTWAKGNPSDVTAGSSMVMGYHPLIPSYVISSVKNGAGTLYPLRINAVNNAASNQIYLSTSGPVGINGVPSDFYDFEVSGTSYFDGYFEVYGSSILGGSATINGDLTVYGDLDLDNYDLNNVGTITADKSYIAVSDPKLEVLSPTNLQEVKILDTSVPEDKKGLELFYDTTYPDILFGWDSINGNLYKFTGTLVKSEVSDGVLKEGYKLDYNTMDFYQIVETIATKEEALEEKLTIIYSPKSVPCYKLDDNFDSYLTDCNQSIANGTKREYVLKENCRFDEYTGKFYCKQKLIASKDEAVIKKGVLKQI